MANLRYCSTCEKDVEPEIFDADNIWCPDCLGDLKYYDYDAEMADEKAILMEFEKFSGAMDFITTTPANKRFQPTPPA